MECGNTEQNTLPIPDPNAPPQSPTAGSSSTYGGVFTPKGSLKILIVFAGFDNDAGDQQAGGWPEVSLDDLDDGKGDLQVPNFVNPTTGYIDPAYIFNNDTEFGVYATAGNTDNHSISRFYYDMSFGKFKFTADVFKDPATGKPVRVNIDTTDITIPTWSSCNKLVVDKMMQIAPNFDWSPYDNKKNKPLYTTENSGYAPDNKPDYVVIVYRYSTGWKPQPKKDMDGWIGSGGGFSKLSGVDQQYNGYELTDAGFTFCIGGYAADIDAFRGMFLHEVAHELFSAPHILGANNVVGTRFYTSSHGWGQCTGEKMMMCASAWERYILGWAKINAQYTKGGSVSSDIKSVADLSPDGLYTLRDFVSTGDAIRVLLPGTTDQFIWIENHQKKSVFDHNPWALKGDAPSKEGEKIADIDKGIYMYIETILDDTAAIKRGILNPGANGIKLLNAQGNFDYTHNAMPKIDPNYYWGSFVYDFKREQENPVAGTNPYVRFRDDLVRLVVSSSKKKDSLIYPDNVISHNSDYNSGGDNEQVYLVRETDGSNTAMLYENSGGRNEQGINIFNRRSTAFQVGDRIGMDTNPALVSYPKFIQQRDTLGPYLFNGLSIKIIDQQGDNMLVQIKYAETAINNNMRYTGKVTLPNITQNDLPDMVIKSGKTIRVDKSGTVNKTKLLDGSFIDYSVFKCSPNAKLSLEPNANLIVENSSALILKATSVLEVNNGAVVTIKKGGNLVIEGNGKIIVRDGGKVVIEEDGYLTYHKDAIINLEKDNSVLEIKGHIMMLQSGTDFTFTGTGFIRYGITLSDAYVNSTTPKIGGNYNPLTLKPYHTFTIIGSGTADKVIEVSKDAEMRHDALLAQLTIQNGKIVMEENAVVNILENPLYYSNVLLTSSTGTDNRHRGLTIYGYGSKTIENSTFERGIYGINVALSSFWDTVSIKGCTFKNCFYGVYSIGKGLTIQNCIFNYNSTGWLSDGMEYASVISECTFGNHLDCGISFSGSTGTLRVSKTSISSGITGIRLNTPSELTLRCTDMRDNLYGIEAYYGSTVNLSSLENAGYANFKNNETALYFSNAKRLKLTTGLNSFYGNNNWIFYGSLLTCGDIDGTQNLWSPSISSNYPISGSNYKLVSSFGGKNLTITDNKPESSEYSCLNISGIKVTPPSCIACKVIKTPSFPSYIKINDAYAIAAAQFSQAKTAEDLTKVIKMLSELVNVKLTPLLPEEFTIIDNSYTLMLQAFALQVQKTNFSQQNKTPFVTANSLIALQAIDQYAGLTTKNGYLTICLSSTPNPTPGLRAVLDKVAVFRLMDQRNTALLALNTIKSSNLSTEQWALVNYWDCLLAKEIKILSSSSPSSLFAPSLDESCSTVLTAALTAQRNVSMNTTSSSNPTSNIPVANEQIKAVVTPNPIINGQSLILIDIPYSSTLKIALFDNSNRIVLDLKTDGNNYQAGHYELPLSVPESGTGVYTLKIISNKESLSIPISIIK